jgi:L,D-transpeptidase YbiS
MAMKRWFWFMIAPLVVLIATTLVLVFTVRDGETYSQDSPVLSDSTYVRLPQDKRSALKELQRARRSLAQVKPTGPYIVIDTHANQLSLRTQDSVLFRGSCSTGSGGVLIDSLTGRKWIFNTPRGIFKVDSKIKQPWWRKPDWAFIEENEPPPKDETERLDPEMLGDFALGFGHGYYIHGTIYERLLGVSVTHGCVRLGSDDLKYVYDRVRVGTPVYIF